MNLTAQIDKWESYWARTNDPSQVERSLTRLRWLADFSFACGASIGLERYRAVQDQISRGERRLAEMDGFPVEATEASEPTNVAYLGTAAQLEPEWATR
jgi:hypothetical protein